MPQDTAAFLNILTAMPLPAGEVSQRLGATAAGLQGGADFPVAGTRPMR